MLRTSPSAVKLLLALATSIEPAAANALISAVLAVLLFAALFAAIVFPILTGSS
ncbi:hypothetical protein D3C85_1842900 [compost metagenome]